MYLSLRDPALPPLQVLELGCGVGTVGIQFAQLVPNCSVTLTDLESAREMVERNMSSAHLAFGSSLNFVELDWAKVAADDTGLSAAYPADLILLADCFYNNNMCANLVTTINALVSHGREPWQAPVVVGYKFRDESEQAFFRAMERDFEVTYYHKLQLPDLDGVDEHVRLMVYRSRKRRKANSEQCPKSVEHLPIRKYWE